MFGQKSFSFLLLIISCTASFGQNVRTFPVKRCPVKTINFEQGLINNTITDVITDGIGFTWFSTETGLQRYNGYILETITPVADGDTIHINYPVFFLSGKKNSILIGYKKGILEYNPKNNSFKKIFSISDNPDFSLLPIKETGKVFGSCRMKQESLFIIAIKMFLTRYYCRKHQTLKQLSVQQKSPTTILLQQTTIIFLFACHQKKYCR